MKFVRKCRGVEGRGDWWVSELTVICTPWAMRAKVCESDCCNPWPCNDLDLAMTKNNAVDPGDFGKNIDLDHDHEPNDLGKNIDLDLDHDLGKKNIALQGVMILAYYDLAVRTMKVFGGRVGLAYIALVRGLTCIVPVLYRTTEKNNSAPNIAMEASNYVQMRNYALEDNYVRYIRHVALHHHDHVG